MSTDRMIEASGNVKGAEDTEASTARTPAARPFGQGIVTAASHDGGAAIADTAGFKGPAPLSEEMAAAINPPAQRQPAQRPNGTDHNWETAASSAPPREPAQRPVIYTVASHGCEAAPPSPNAVSIGFDATELPQGIAVDANGHAPAHVSEEDIAAFIDETMHREPAQREDAATVEAQPDEPRVPASRDDSGSDWLVNSDLANTSGFGLWSQREPASRTDADPSDGSDDPTI